MGVKFSATQAMCAADQRCQCEHFATDQGPERMKDSAQIRSANIADAMAIEACVKAAYGHYIERIGKPPGPMLANYAELIQQQTVFVADADGIVGVLVLIRTPAGVLLENVAVHPDHQHKGLGRRLINFAESEARGLVFKKLDLYTHENMHENIEIYKALGYTETGRKKERGYDRVYMRKNLSG